MRVEWRPLITGARSSIVSPSAERWLRPTPGCTIYATAGLSPAGERQAESAEAVVSFDEDSARVTARVRPGGVLDDVTDRSLKPGDRIVSQSTELTVVHHPDGDEMEPYERLLGDAMAGDGILFAREDGVEAAWTIVDPILGAATPVHEYEPGSWGPAQADALAADVGGWRSTPA